MAKGKAKANRHKHGNGTLVLRGAVWLARWTGPDGRKVSRSTGTGDKEEAERKLREFASESIKDNIEASRARALAYFDGRKAEEDAFLQQQRDATPALALADGWEAFLESPNPSGRIHRKPTGTASAPALHVLECQYGVFVSWVRDCYNADRRNPVKIVEMRQVTKEAAQRFADFIREKHSPTTYNKYIQLLARIWRYVAANPDIDSRIAANPFESIDSAAKNEHSREPITEEQFKAILENVTGEMRLLFLLGYEAGMRLGDAATIGWKEVDMVRRKIVYTPNKTERKAGTIAQPPIPARLFDELAKTPPAERKGAVLPGLAEKYQHGNRDGITKGIQRILEGCGIATKCEIGKDERRARRAVDYGFHSLRHGYISNLGNAGVPLALAKVYAGHVSEEMSAHYFHESGESNARSIDKLNQVAAGDGGGNLAALRDLLAVLSPDELRQARQLIDERI